MFDIHPLSFDRVHPGHITTSNFPLFTKLPIELFPHVTCYLTRMDLNALAAVDRDCRLLAGLERFKDVGITVGSKKQTVSEQMAMLERHCGCVRRLNVFHGPTNDNEGDTGSRVCRDARLVYTALSVSFDNLVTLEWVGPTIISADLFGAIKDHAKLRSLHLKGIVLDPQYVLSLPCESGTGRHQGSLKLETIALEVHFPFSFTEDATGETKIRFFESLFRIVAPSVERVNWKGNFPEQESIYIDPSITFTELRHLTLDMISFDDGEILRVFMDNGTTSHTSKLRSLALNVSTLSAWEYLKMRGNIPTLKHFTWINYNVQHASYEDIHGFLEDNAGQLESVHFHYAVPQAIIDEKLIPLLSTAAISLKSLRLVSDGSSFPESTLRALGSILTLNCLWLSAGHQEVQNTWEVDHALLRGTLSPLQNLRTLAFSQDTYITDPAPHPLAPRFCDYYTAKSFPEELDLRAYLTPEENIAYERGMCGMFEVLVSQQLWHVRKMGWERWHAERMGRIAQTYREIFPKLEWCFVGQVAVDILDGGVGVPGEREQCLSSLRKRMDMALWRPL